jgi:hypothetical protein
MPLRPACSKATRESWISTPGPVRASLAVFQHAMETSLHISAQVADVMPAGTFPVSIDARVLQRVPDLMLQYGQLTRPFSITALTGS